MDDWLDECLHDSVYCELCSTYAVKGIVYPVPGGGYICEDCADHIARQDGIEVRKKDDDE